MIQAKEAEEKRIHIGAGIKENENRARGGEAAGGAGMRCHTHDRANLVGAVEKVGVALLDGGEVFVGPLWAREET